MFDLSKTYLTVRAPIDEGTQRTIVIKKDLTTADGLAVDWIYNHIYWTDTGKNTIELANFEGNMRKILVQDALEEPRAIAVNPLDGWVVILFQTVFLLIKRSHLYVDGCTGRIGALNRKSNEPGWTEHTGKRLSLTTCGGLTG